MHLVRFGLIGRFDGGIVDRSCLVPGSVYNVGYLEINRLKKMNLLSFMLLVSKVFLLHGNLKI